MTKTKPKLYSYWRSSCSWRVRIALSFKGVDYDTEPVHLVNDGGQQHKAEFRALNPMEQVPVLVYDEVPLTQSLAIIEFLEETHPKPSLLPTDPVARARSRAISHIICSGTQPLQNLSVLQKLGPEKKNEWAKDVITNGLAAVELMAKDTSGTYCVGDQVTIADLCLIPQIYNAKRFGVDLSAFPTIMKINEACQEHEAFKKAAPNVQPDCPEDQRVSLN